MNVKEYVLVPRTLYNNLKKTAESESVDTSKLDDKPNTISNNINTEKIDEAETQKELEMPVKTLDINQDSKNLSINTDTESHIPESIDNKTLQDKQSVNKHRSVKRCKKKVRIKKVCKNLDKSKTFNWLSYT